LRSLLEILGKQNLHSKEQIKKEAEYLRNEEGLRISGFKDDNDVLTMLRRINAVKKDSKNMYYLTRNGKTLYNALDNKQKYNKLLLRLLLEYANRYSRFTDIINEIISRYKKNKKNIGKLEIQIKINDKKDTNSIISLLLGIGILKKDNTKEFIIDGKLLASDFDEILLGEIKKYLEQHNGYRLERNLIKEISEHFGLQKSIISEKINNFIKSNELYREYEAGYSKIITEVTK